MHFNRIISLLHTIKMGFPCQGSRIYTTNLLRINKENNWGITLQSVRFFRVEVHCLLLLFLHSWCFQPLVAAPESKTAYRRISFSCFFFSSSQGDRSPRSLHTLAVSTGSLYTIFSSLTSCKVKLFLQVVSINHRLLTAPPSCQKAL